MKNKPRLLQNFSFVTATYKKCMFCRTKVRACKAKNCMSLCKTNRVLQQAQPAYHFAPILQQTSQKDASDRLCGSREHPRHYENCPAYFPLINKIRRETHKTQ